MAQPKKRPRCISADGGRWPQCTVAWHGDSQPHATASRTCPPRDTLLSGDTEIIAGTVSRPLEGTNAFRESLEQKVASARAHRAPRAVADSPDYRITPSAPPSPGERKHRPPAGPRNRLDSAETSGLPPPRLSDFHSLLPVNGDSEQAKPRHRPAANSGSGAVCGHADLDAFFPVGIIPSPVGRPRRNFRSIRFGGARLGMNQVTRHEDRCR